MIWRPNFLWLPMGLIAGTTVGASVGFVSVTAVVMTGEGRDGIAAIMAGFIWGAIGGGISGVLVGLLMSLAVGSHLMPQEARDRGCVLGATFATLPALALTSLLLPSPAALFLTVVAALAAGWLGRWMGALVTPTAQHV